MAFVDKNDLHCAIMCRSVVMSAAKNPPIPKIKLSLSLCVCVGAVTFPDVPLRRKTANDLEQFSSSSSTPICDNNKLRPRGSFLTL
uniref:Uncharacterized protein n=1 Tax=Globodera rostochiensis TaxID=31243 RepID=A0A914H7B1_GLORO